VNESECESELHKLASEIGPIKGGSDGRDFKKAVLGDDSLHEWRKLGERNESGFA